MSMQLKGSTLTPPTPLSLSQGKGGVLFPARVLQLLVLGAIRVYQSTLGPALPRSCRFEPSCSRYAFEAVEQYGVLRGGWLAVRRLARCQPWGGSGYDPVL